MKTIETDITVTPDGIAVVELRLPPYDTAGKTPGRGDGG